MDRTALKQMLDGGYIEDYAFDMKANTFTIRVEVRDNDGLSSYDVRFEVLSQFLFDSESRGIKERLELTEIWIKETPEASSSEEWTVVISMWDMTHVTIRCTSILVDGDPVR